MQEIFKETAEKIDKLSEKKPIKVISHYDTDGICAAAIFSRTLKQWQKPFSIEIVKGLDKEFIESLPEDKILIFLDLGSGSLKQLSKKKTEVFILDHHEVTQKIPSNVTIINPTLHNEEPLCGAAISYLFAKTLGFNNKDLATLSVIGMVGDNHEKHIGKTYDKILKDADTTIKKGLLFYPSTRPLDRVLEYTSSHYIPGVTGSYKGVTELLREAGINKEGPVYKSIHELTKEEMSNLITAIMVRSIDKTRSEELIGNLYLVKFFNKLEDARELSARINACSRMNHPELALGFCLGNEQCKQESEKIHREYKHSLVAALRFVSETKKISGEKYIIINAKDNIKDTIIGTVASIISHSSTYKKGTIIIALAYNKDKIKVSARVTGNTERNVREVLARAIESLEGGEVGGHPNAAGCLIPKEKEEIFLAELRKSLDVELVKA